MKKVEPKVLLIAETKMVPGGLEAHLESVGAPDWTTDAKSDSEKLAEAAGRLCYRSWAAGLNPNVTKVREGNGIYLKNIIDTEHGSVMEHAQLTFIFANVSRVLTHELVRHRIGVGISQESLRYVRLADLGVSIPSCFAANTEAIQLFEESIKQAEQTQRRFAEIFDIDNLKDFGVKKKLTSAFRRAAPLGLATNIMWSCNFRTLRFVIRQRTNRAAEEEIRIVFGEVYRIVKGRYPNLFQDFTEEMVDGLVEVSSPHAKA